MKNNAFNFVVGAAKLYAQPIEIEGWNVDNERAMSNERVLVELLWIALDFRPNQFICAIGFGCKAVECFEEELVFGDCEMLLLVY